MEHLLTATPTDEGHYLQRYWIQLRKIKRGKYEVPLFIFAVYKGPYPNMEEQIMSSNTSQQKREDTNQTIRLEFFMYCLKVAELVCKNSNCCGTNSFALYTFVNLKNVSLPITNLMTLYSALDYPVTNMVLMQPAGQLNTHPTGQPVVLPIAQPVALPVVHSPIALAPGLAGINPILPISSPGMSGRKWDILSDIDVTSAWSSKEISVVANPYFRSAKGYSMPCRRLCWVPLAAALLAFVLTIVFGATKRIPACIVAASSFILFFILLMVFCCWHTCKLCCREVKREEILQLVDISDNTKYADIFRAWGKSVCTDTSLEIVCYRELDAVQLITLMATAMELSLIHICRCRRAI
eukprot:TRINITY_DN3385_c0_g1_i8.p1 TRINITY_DN3385_c0_g1~~TRINITY_DN3385_c0_g1_i8.p1  ORF type:complete len:391 (+),score=66.95 TRINITY_DN3385_c0_g1_i8:117-1175(+)